MNIRTISCTILLAVGFSLGNCDVCECPAVQGLYFDIKGMRLNQFASTGLMAFNDTVAYAKYLGVDVQYEVNYISQNSPRRNEFSLISSASACDCAFNGESGSKTEMLSKLQVITLNDFDAQHVSGDTINDLLDISNAARVNQSLDSYLLQNTGLIRTEVSRLRLTKKPASNPQFHVRIIAELSTGEVYDEVSVPIRIN